TARIVLAASALAVAAASPQAEAGRGRAAPAPEHKSATYLSPVTKNRRIVGFKKSSARPGFLRRTRDALVTTFGKKARSAVLPETTLWIPGHTLGWRSLRPAMKHFLGNRQ